VSSAAVTLRVASQKVFILLFISLSTRSGSFWIRPRILFVSHIYFVRWVVIEVLNKFLTECHVM
jgi:hypothetical protein